MHGTYAPALTRRETSMFGEASLEAGEALESLTQSKLRTSRSLRCRFPDLAFLSSIATHLS